MSGINQITLTTQTGEWLYFAPADMKRVQLTKFSYTFPDLETMQSNRGRHCAAFFVPITKFICG